MNVVNETKTAGPILRPSNIFNLLNIKKKSGSETEEVLSGEEVKPLGEEAKKIAGGDGIINPAEWDHYCAANSFTVTLKEKDESGNDTDVVYDIKNGSVTSSAGAPYNPFISALNELLGVMAKGKEEGEDEALIEKIGNKLKQLAENGLTLEEWNSVTEEFDLEDMIMNDASWSHVMCGVEGGKSISLADFVARVERLAIFLNSGIGIYGNTVAKVFAAYCKDNDFVFVDPKYFGELMKTAFLRLDAKLTDCEKIIAHLKDKDKYFKQQLEEYNKGRRDDDKLDSDGEWLFLQAYILRRLFDGIRQEGEEDEDYNKSEIKKLKKYNRVLEKAMQEASEEDYPHFTRFMTDFLKSFIGEDYKEGVFNADDYLYGELIMAKGDAGGGKNGIN